mgnify:CR=1 FL=1
MEIKLDDGEGTALLQQLLSLKSKCDCVVSHSQAERGKGSGDFYDGMLQAEEYIQRTQMFLSELIENTCSFLTKGMEAMQDADRAAAEYLKGE